MRQTIRSFIAVEIGLDVRSRALQLIKTLRNTPAKVKWIEPQNMHFTVLFLGDVAMPDIAKLCHAVEAAVRPLPAFEIEVRGAGSFPPRGNLRTVWLGVQRGLDEFRILHHALEKALEPFGIRDDNHRFTPHLTLGRVRGVEGNDELSELVQANKDYFAGTMFVDEVTLFSSDLSGGTPVYEPLHTVELNG